MKGLKPLNEDFVFILEKQSSVLESKKNSNDEYLLEGIAAVFGKENNNHRIYEENEYLPHLDYLQDKISQQRLLGELDHPEKFDISLKNISHLVTDLNYNKGERTLKIKVKLWFVFLGWCMSDIRENYYDMKTRYLFETDPELLELQSFVKELIKKEKK